MRISIRTLSKKRAVVTFNHMLLGQRPICCINFRKIIFFSSQLQVRTSYLPNEILWGHKFDHNVLVYDKKMGSYQIFHSRVNKTVMDDTPRLSARQLEMRSKRNSSGLSNSTTSENSPSKKLSKPVKKEKKFEHH